MLANFRHLSLRQLRLAAKLGTELSLSRTANELHMTQPAASRSLAQLEYLLGIQLFHRAHKKLVPTAAGMRFIHHAQRVLDQLATAEHEISGASVADEIRVGAIASFSSELISQAVEKSTLKFPHSRIKIFTGNIGFLYGQLLTGAIDAMLSHAELSVDLNRVEVSPIYEEYTSIVAGPMHRLCKRKKLDWRIIADQPWILPPPFTPSRPKLDRILAVYRATPSPSLPDVEVESVSVALNIISGSRYLWSLAHREARLWEGVGLVRLLAQPDSVAQGHMCCLQLRGTDSKEVIVALIEFLRELA